jgi:glycosyltransferase involved in cell wall biosynthesis
VKILLFGTGDYYQKYKRWFRKEDIAGLIDNDANKQGTLIDGYEVYPPQMITVLQYDCVVILSVHEAGMRRQLRKLGVADDKIYKFSDLYRHPEIIMTDQPVCLWGSGGMLSEIMSIDDQEAVLIMSHNLDLNGAALALFYLAEILKKNGYFILFVSWSDGELRKYLFEESIPVIIDPNLQMKTQKEIEWVRKFHRIICNTLNYYQFLSDRNLEDKIIWWLHDHRMFYESLDRELLHKIREDNLTVCAVSSIAEDSFKEYFPNFSVKRLVYGIPDVKAAGHEKSEWNGCILDDDADKKQSVCEFIMIGNVQKYKGQDILIKALGMLGKEICARIHVKIVGFRPTAYASMVKEMAEELGETVTFIPPMDRDGIHRLLDRADVLVCPSRIDTMSIVTNEGMQHGVPCIVSDAAGVAAYITDGVDGFIVKQGDVEELAQKILWCVEHCDRLKQVGKAARFLYEQYFSMEIFERELLKIVQEAL